MDNSLGIYIHIPFCDGKCFYCDFFSGKYNTADMDIYTDALCSQLLYWAKKAESRNVDSVYFGGGTPSLLGTERLVRILNTAENVFNFCSPEITLEVNPTSANLDFAALRSAGFNRISAGLQSVNENELALLGRRHTAKEALLTVERAKSGGFDNISLDLMLGIPEQTELSFEKSLDFVIGLKIQHISCYMLKLEENTPMYRNRQNLRLCSDEEYARLYELMCKRLAQSGFSHYEISNFCKDGFESRHNMKYWKSGEYIGIGPSAHSFFEGKRFYYERSFEKFYQCEYCFDSDGGGYEEFIMLSLRLKSGLDCDKFEKKYGFRIPDTVFKKSKLFEAHGLMKASDRKISLTEQGFLLSNEIIVQLLIAFNMGMK